MKNAKAALGWIEEVSMECGRYLLALGKMVES
jgi:hypothetical protein